MGNRTFIIMLAACLLQVLVVAGTVSYVAVRDTGAAEVVEPKTAHADDCDHEYADEDDGDDEAEDGQYDQDDCDYEDDDSGETPGAQPEASPGRINRYGY